MEYHIYKITNKNNNKIYIGITSKTVQHRFKNHIRKAKIGSTTNLHQSMMKHGKESANAKKVIVDGVVYKNMGICSEELGINRNTLTRRCNSEKFPNYKYC
ncbi:homing endonuclease [Staphylococcus phage vB_SauM-HM01]|nr:homing endonuclease [Staphylococcus phage vB_SauM-HM01]WBF47901.1 hypothetical protein SSP49_76 [Staphylococcus phage SSP49]